MFFKSKSKNTTPKNTSGANASGTESKQSENTNSASGNITAGTGSVKHILAVASGKGGVGKSTVSSHLAMSLAAQGKKVGLLDADIYGPSQSRMLGEAKPPRTQGQAILPIETHGLKYMSMGAINAGGKAVVMRSPLAIKAIDQFLRQVLWGELDYLILDLPPGTGDIQLTLAQQARISAAIIVTTPQKLACEIAGKGLEMFESVNVPILGVVENMSGFGCPKCGETTSVFHSGGGEAMADQFKVPFLGSIPLDPELMFCADEGLAIFKEKPDSVTAKAFQTLGEKVESEIDTLSEHTQKNEPAKIQIFQENGKLEIVWKDGVVNTFDPFELRMRCPCAQCVDEVTGEKILKAESVPLDIKIKNARHVGRYGINIQFSDTHSTGIYKFEKLKEWGKEEKQEVQI